MRKYIAWLFLCVFALALFAAPPLVFIPWDVWLIGLGIMLTGFAVIARTLYLMEGPDLQGGPLQTPQDLSKLAWYDRLIVVCAGMIFAATIGSLLFAFLHIFIESLGWWTALVVPSFAGILYAFNWSLNVLSENNG